MAALAKTSSAMRQATLIGGRGFIGRHLHRRLLRDGWSVWVPQRDDAALAQRELGHVFYCAGLTADFAERPFATVEAHVSLLSRVLNQASYRSLVYLSSTRLYDSLGEVDASEASALSLLPDNPRHLYDLSKALGESLCRVAGAGRARVARLSCVWNGGADDDGFLAKLMRDVLACRAAHAGKGRPRLPIDSAPAAARDYVHVDDAVDALLALVAHTGFAIYNVAGGRNVANAELFARLGDASGCDVVATQSHAPAAPPRISIARMAEAFGWCPADTLDRASRTVDQELACSSS